MTRVLIVDPSEERRSALAFQLRMAKYDVYLAKDGITALGMLKKTRFDTVVTAQTMPHIVPVEQIGVVALLGQNLLQRACDGGFTRCTQPGKPDHQRCLGLLRCPVPAIHRVGMPYNIAAH